ncbi:hypothetical protein PVAP13_3KG056888 [Panicum virgatum]|uniref:Uncharacterized protein n=1 Tax=Panicum virgatum TaxID=38727 RepID=A0A8T0UNH6_PANVG|nr:hypothetical protein PVAP13_3KG056888 [Panicum virgatum]
MEPSAMTCRLPLGPGDKRPTPGDERRGAERHLLRPRCDAHAAEHILPGKIDTRSAAERLHRRPRTGRHTARQLTSSLRNQTAPSRCRQTPACASRRHEGRLVPATTSTPPTRGTDLLTT